NCPNAAWAQRYGENFDLAIRFLDTSKQVEDEKRLAQKRQQQAALRRTRRQRTMAVIGLVIALSFAIWALWEKSKAEEAIREKIQAFEDIRKAKNTIEAEKYRTEKALEKAEEAKKNTELNIARFKEMVNTTFGFLLESSQHESFLRWADRTAVIERLIPALHLMIDLFEELEMEEKQYWHDTLFSMKDSAKLDLLSIMGTEAVQRAKEKKEFQIHILQITKEITKEKINPSTNGAYFIEPDEKIAIIPYIKDPPNHRYKFRYKAIRGKMAENYYSISKDALEGYDLIAIQAVSDDDKNEILAQKIIKIKINDLEKLLNDLEKTLKLKLEL
ncbi:MAG: hypothetical protein JXA96_14555, partial [Sedimentisphaerales bacterium]|nr:hypothetical protein [Sedimentisphaerales bacterium]